MADVKGVNMHKRNAMGENVTGMKKGGATRMSKADCGPMLKKGGKVKSKKK